MDEITRISRSRRDRRAPIVWIALGLILAASAPVLAHDPGLSSLELRVSRNDITADLSLNVSDAAALGNRESLGAVAQDAIAIRVGERVLSGVIESVVFDEHRNARVRILYTAAIGSEIVVRSRIPERLARGHREFVSIRMADGDVVAERMLDAASNEADADIAAPPPGLAATGRRFFTLGVWHILTGYDHLLFLAAVLVVVRRGREAIQTITAFTAAHSLTLAVATTGLVSAPGRIVEPLIAASIVYVGLENLLRPERRARWKLTFAFGLVHGFGFAATLRELGIGASGAAVALPLASFNAGVEAGQLAIAMLVVPLAWKLRARRVLNLQATSAWSLLVVAAGSYWLVERLL